MSIKQGELVLRLLVLQRWLEFLTPTYIFFCESLSVFSHTCCRRDARGHGATRDV